MALASSELGSQVDAELNTLSISSSIDVATFRALPRQDGNMATVIAALPQSNPGRWVSRKRIRHDALKLLRAGSL